MQGNGKKRIICVSNIQFAMQTKDNDEESEGGECQWMRKRKHGYNGTALNAIGTKWLHLIEVCMFSLNFFGV